MIGLHASPKRASRGVRFAVATKILFPQTAHEMDARLRSGIQIGIDGDGLAGSGAEIFCAIEVGGCGEDHCVVARWYGLDKVYA